MSLALFGDPGRREWAQDFRPCWPGSALRHGVPGEGGGRARGEETTKSADGGRVRSQSRRTDDLPAAARTGGFISDWTLQTAAS
jgi:hypothetical protein